MRLLFITNSYSRVHLYYLAKVLSSEHEITCVSFEKRNDPRAENKGDVYRRLVLVPPPNPVLTTKMMHALVTRTPVAVLSNRSREMVRVIRRFSTAIPFDVVLIEQVAMAQYVFSISGGVKLYFPVDSGCRLKAQRIHQEKSPFRRAMYWLDYQLMKAYEQRTYELFTDVLFVSQRDAEHAVQNQALAAEKVHILPNSVDVEYFKPGSAIPPNKPTLVFVGNLGDFKSAHAVVWFHTHVWPKLKAAAPGLTWFIVGREPSARVKMLGSIDPTIIVTGFVEDLRPYLDQATIFISPLQLGTGMKNRILEAMAMAKPIVATPLSVEGLNVTDGQEVIIAHDDTQFVWAIRHLLEDSGKRDKLGLRARQYAVTCHSLPRLRERFLGIVEKARSKYGQGTQRARY